MKNVLKMTISIYICNVFLKKGKVALFQFSQYAISKISYASHFFKLTQAHKLEKSDNLSEKKLILQKYTTKNLL